MAKPISELRGKGVAELKTRLAELRRESLNLRFQQASGQLENTAPPSASAPRYCAGAHPSDPRRANFCEPNFCKKEKLNARARTQRNCRLQSRG